MLFFPRSPKDRAPVFSAFSSPGLEYLEAAVILIKKKRNVPHCFRFPWLIAACVLAARARGFGAAGSPPNPSCTQEPGWRTLAVPGNPKGTGSERSLL